MRKKSTKVQNPRYMKVMVSWEIAHDDSLLHSYYALLNHKLIPLPSHLSAQNIMLYGA